jgi:hypothetical protein
VPSGCRAASSEIRTQRILRWGRGEGKSKLTQSSKGRIGASTLPHHLHSFKMAFILRKAVSSDVPAMADTYLSAFENDIISTQVFPRSSPSSRGFWISSLADEINDPHAHFLVMTQSDSTPPGRIVAFAKWVMPGARIESPPGIDGWPQSGDPEVAVEYFKALAQAHQRYMGASPHWYLEIIAVRQGHMRKGLARSLIAWGTERSEQDGLPCYLEATAETQPIYEKYRFRPLGRQLVRTPTGALEAVSLYRDITE